MTVKYQITDDKLELVSEPTMCISLSTYDMLLNKARLYDDIVTIRNCRNSAYKDEIFTATLNITCIWYNQSPAEVLGTSREKKLMDVRKAIVYCLTQLKFPQKEIAKFLNRSDHTTVIHLRDTVLGIMGYDHDYSSEMKHLLNKVKIAIHDLQKHS